MKAHEFIFESREEIDDLEKQLLAKYPEIDTLFLLTVHVPLECSEPLRDAYITLMAT